MRPDENGGGPRFTPWVVGFTRGSDTCSAAGRMLLRRASAAACVGLGAAAYVAKEYVAYQQVVDDAVVESSLPLTHEAQRTKVVRCPRLLSAEEIAGLDALAKGGGAGEKPLPDAIAAALRPPSTSDVENTLEEDVLFG